MREVVVKQHAFQRFLERVSKKTATEVRQIDAIHWYTEAIMNGRELGKAGRGCTNVLYRGHVIVYDKSKHEVITAKPYHPTYDDESLFYEIKDEVNQLVTKQLVKQMKPIQRQQKELLIQMHESEINKLRARNPKIQKSIGIKIDNLKEEIETLEKQILGVKQVALTYNVDL